MSTRFGILAVLVEGSLPPAAASHARAGGAEPDRIGSLFDESGRPVAGATVRAHIHGKVIEVAADAAGSFRVPLPTETAGGRVWGSLQARATDGRLGVLSVYQAEGRREPVRVVLKPARELAVSVVDRQGKPVTGAAIHLLNKMHPILEGRTDTEGCPIRR